MTDQSTDDTFIVESSDIPRVLTRNIVPTLTQGLDASDVLECYALIRSAPLHGIANSTIHIQKMAIGVRYRPTGAAAVQQPNKEKMELTLEYGPQRIGPYEAMPYVQGSDQMASYIGWDNEGKVYYTTKIVTESFVSSYYMTSITGAVLDKMLLQALEYCQLRKRYQPLAVYSSTMGDKHLPSSSSQDFASYLWKQLARLGVEIEPILPPPMYQARLWVDAWEKVATEPSVASQAATFYQKLYQCLEAIGTDDYTLYTPTVQPTQSPMPTNSITAQVEQPSTNPTMIGGSSLSPTAVSTSKASDVLQSQIPTISPVTDAPSAKESDDNSTRKLEEEVHEMTASPLQDLDEDDWGNGDWDNDDMTDNSNSFTLSPTSSGSSPGTSPTPVPMSEAENDPDSSEEGFEKANQAAQEAQEAADAAKNAEGTEAAADAAQAAADAAQAAADATSNAANQAAMEALLSGSGGPMASIISTCFTNPQYELGIEGVNGTTTVTAYLYKDSSHVFRLNLSKPYIDVVKLNDPLPVAYNPLEFGSGGDFVDWMLALMVLGSTVMMVIIILQQMGYVVIPPLSRFQRWYFNPRKYDYEGKNMDENATGLEVGEDGIPLSMGGRPSFRNSPMRVHRTAGGFSPMHSATDLPALPTLDDVLVNGKMGSISSHNVAGELEMKTMSGRRRRGASMTFSDHGSQGSISDDEQEFNTDGLPKRMMRDPEMVDFPHLRSMSKVAVPVGSHGFSSNSSVGSPEE
eukprot:Nitzschia sp. Nitz4//scaffold1_size375055//27441//29675//NITZ4_000213-RA/size375055-processed-gene-0.406-mRNA-1//-1//CDS//3329540856//503//frame0